MLVPVRVVVRECTPVRLASRRSAPPQKKPPVGPAAEKDLVSTIAAKNYTQYTTRYDTGYGRPMSVRHAMLALLSEGPKYGLRLREEFEDRTGEGPATGTWARC